MKCLLNGKYLHNNTKLRRHNQLCPVLEVRNTKELVVEQVIPQQKFNCWVVVLNYDFKVCPKIKKNLWQRSALSRKESKNSFRGLDIFKL